MVVEHNIENVFLNSLLSAFTAAWLWCRLKHKINFKIFPLKLNWNFIRYFDTIHRAAYGYNGNIYLSVSTPPYRQILSFGKYYCRTFIIFCWNKC